jgi:acetyl-CoA C-acetyltransferase
MEDIVILSAARTPIGSFQGCLSSLTAPQLGSIAIRGALEQAGLRPDDVEQVIMGNVLSAGLGQAPARQAGIGAGIPHAAGALTINKVCGSGMRAVMLAANDIRCGDYQIAVAGGMESMSNAPFVLPRTLPKLGDFTVTDVMIRDGLWDPYNDIHMGGCAEICAAEYAITREDQDAYALESYRRAQRATESGAFDAEIVPVTRAERGTTVTIDRDEEPFKAPLEKMPSLRPVFKPEGGTVTAANASKINDGAAALIVASADRAHELGVRPMARIVGHATMSQAPEWFTTAPVGAIQKVLARTGHTLDEIDLIEVNEAFAAVALAVQRALGIDPAKLNVNGGAVALGHPLGASGARILTTLLHALAARQGRLGLAAICLGGGEATALVVERIG